MSRIRTIKPEWVEDEPLAETGPHARLLSVGLIVLADDHGRGRATEVILAAKFFHTEPDPIGCVREALARLSRIEFVELYTVRGQRYYRIRNWNKHQRVDKPGKPRFPGPDEADDGPQTPPDGSGPGGDSGDSRESLAPDRRTSDLRPPSEDHAGARDSGSASPPEAGVDRQHVTAASPGQDGARSLTALGDEIRAGVVKGYSRLAMPAPRETRGLTWPGWTEVARWAREKAQLVGGRDELDVARHLVRCFLRSERARELGYPIAFLVQNPNEYWQDVLPAEVA